MDKIKQVIVGVYECGYEQYQLSLRSGRGGEFYALPSPGALPSIKVGADHDEFRDVAAVLMHEVMELTMDRMKCRYEPTNDMSKDHSAYVFIMNHPTFSDVCAKTSEYVIKALPDIKAAWEKWIKQAKEKK